jgi:hypothetical protein
MGGAGPEPEGPTDSEILERLRDAAISTGPVPAEVLRAAYASFAWRVTDAELAELVCDRGVGDGAATGGRSGGALRLLSFCLPREGAVEVRVVATGDTFLLTGQVVPPRPGETRVVHSAGTTTAPIDDHGSFIARSIGRGPVRLRLKLAGARCEIVTESIIL